jgi:hypothetical protein
VNGARGRWLALGVLCTSLLAIVIDNTIVNVALPTLVRDLDANVSELQRVVDAYTLVFAALLLLAGTLGDRFGRRRTLLWGLAVFGLASAAAAFAGDVDLLIADRAVMGAGAAFIMPATLSLLISVFTDARERGMAIGIWAATAGLESCGSLPRSCRRDVMSSLPEMFRGDAASRQKVDRLSARSVELLRDGAHVRFDVPDQLAYAGREPRPRPGDDGEGVIERRAERGRGQARGVVGRVRVRTGEIRVAYARGDEPQRQVLQLHLDLRLQADP